jgi:hypothetical protein
MKRCPSCGQLKEDDEFRWKRRLLNRRKARCKECLKVERKGYYEGTKPARLEYKASHQVDKREEARSHSGVIGPWVRK